MRKGLSKQKEEQAQRLRGKRQCGLFEAILYFRMVKALTMVRDWDEMVGRGQNFKGLACHLKNMDFDLKTMETH